MIGMYLLLEGLDLSCLFGSRNTSISVDFLYSKLHQSLRPEDDHPPPLNFCVRIIIFPLVFLLTLDTHKMLWQWINGKIGRASLATMKKGSLTTIVAWMFGNLLGLYIWPWAAKGLAETVFYDMIWGVVAWLGGMVALSLLESFSLFWECKNKN